MAAELKQGARDFLNKKTFAHIATLSADGSPQVSPVWVDCDGDQIWINTAEGREKPENVKRDPRVSISMTNPDNPYDHMLVQGKVVDVTTEGADEHIDKLASKYLGEDTYPFHQEGEVRVILKIEADNITVNKS